MKLRAAVLLLAVLFAGGCKRDKRKVIAVVPKATSHLFWLSVQAGAMAAGAEYGVDVEWNGPPSETDYSRQIQIVDSYIVRHVDGLAVAAAERKALLGSLDRAKAAGIPVTVFDSGVDSDNYMTFLSTNNVEGGQSAARALAKLLGGKGKVAVVLHAPGSASTMDRERGFEEVITKEFPQIKIVATQYSQSDRAKGMAAAENMLTANPDLDGMFASAEPGSVGAAQALKGRGLAGKVKLVAFDSSEGLVEDMRNGVIQALVVQDPFRMGHDAVKTLVDKLNGQDQRKRIDLSARVVMQADLDKPDVKALLFPDVKKYLKQ